VCLLLIHCNCGRKARQANVAGTVCLVRSVECRTRWAKVESEGLFVTGSLGAVKLSIVQQDALQNKRLKKSKRRKSRT